MTTARKSVQPEPDEDTEDFLDDVLPPEEFSRNGHPPHVGPVALEDFVAYMPMHQYIFTPTREMWPATSVNTQIELVSTGKVNSKGKPETLRPTDWLDQHAPVMQMTWCPGEPELIDDRLVSHGGWIEHPGARIFNLYKPPLIEPGDSTKAGPWLEHIERIFPGDYLHIADWLAHRAQRPAEKINHALVLGGAQGIGKDTTLEPVKPAVGPWNFEEVGPSQIMGRFNGFVKSVILRVNEARDLGDVNRYAFYDHMKSLTAAPPDVLRVDEKNLREYSVFNLTGVILTSNHKSDGIYLPPDDRRHYVAWSEASKDDFAPNYWQTLYRWYAAEGNRHVAAWLLERDLSGFDAKAPPPKTPAFWHIVDASRAPEDGELADALDGLGRPDAVTLAEIIKKATTSFADWLGDRRNSRQIPHRLEEAGYVAVRNTSQADGRFKISGKNVVIYGRSDLTLRDRVEAAREKTRW